VRKRGNRNPFAQQNELSEVNITPLADVCLTLVIMFMIVSPMALQALIQVQSSQAVASTSNQKKKEKPLFVDITVDGFRLNNQKIPTEYALYRTLQREIAKKNDKTVMISSAADVRYQYVVRVLDIVKQSGASSLSLVPRKKAAT
jgi:biopolymer transport protein ExbD